ncbi:hypothetical protein E2562_020894 [Oryza meyeriana var. granulata]|uniref:Uncharacterized protein n=1 Tax=Oryza meyeriana var. granulata TaxID=110450 RepID=A0A6G1D621_9ORYZ|nr:hypothetical protein E2562_020894 [Oryza meyeriana var. granulata]
MSDDVMTVSYGIGGNKDDGPGTAWPRRAGGTWRWRQTSGSPAALNHRDGDDGSSAGTTADGE